MYVAKNDTRDGIASLKFLLGQLKYGDESKLIHGQDIYGNTPLFYAVQNKNVRNTKFLLKKGVNINAQNHKGQTPLMISMLNKHIPDITKFLLENENIKLEATDNQNQTAFIYAAKESLFFEHIRLLYSRKANNEVKDPEGHSIHDLILLNKYLYPYVYNNDSFYIF